MIIQKISPDLRTGQRHKLQNSSKMLLEGKERKSKKKHPKRKSSGPPARWHRSINPLFKDRCISFKIGGGYRTPGWQVSLTQPYNKARGILCMY
jgi:hypothetical protein